MAVLRCGGESVVVSGGLRVGYVRVGGTVKRPVQNRRGESDFGYMSEFMVEKSSDLDLVVVWSVKVALTFSQRKERPILSIAPGTGYHVKIEGSES